MIQICKQCNNPKQKFRHTKRPRHGYRHIDENGSWWNGGICPECNKLWQIDYSRKHGHLSIDKVETSHIKKSRLSHEMAKTYLIDKGFTNVIVNPLPNGPDITSNNLKIEVKCICKAKNKNTYDVHAVQETRKLDDLIILVSLEHNIVFLEEMKKHLLQCNKNGKRTVTNLITGIPLRRKVCFYKKC